MRNNDETEADQGFGSQVVESGLGDQSTPPERMTSEEAMNVGADTPDSTETENADEGETTNNDVETFSAPSVDEQLFSPVNHDYDAPYVLLRESAMDWRGTAENTNLRTDVMPETRDQINELLEQMREDMTKHVSKRDVMEAMARVACENPDAVRTELQRWGFR